MAAMVTYPKKAILCVLNNLTAERFAVHGGTQSRFGKFEKGKSAWFASALLAYVSGAQGRHHTDLKPRV
jgi:hypothetical protein